MKAMFTAKVKLVAAVGAAVVLTGTAVPVGIAVAQAAKKEAANGVWGDKAEVEKKALPSSTTPMYGYALTLQKGDTQLPLWLTMKSQKDPASTPSHTAKRESPVSNQE
jgi:heme/copper-type cytochrome/quinol oxidase subunit 1